MENISWVPVVLFCLPFENEHSTAMCAIDDSEGFQNEENQLAQKNENDERQKIYLKIFEKELVKNSEKFEKKNWLAEEDQTLIDLREKALSWVQISKEIPKTKPQICKRRYVRLIENEKKWPKFVDEIIKNGYENKGQNWTEIQKVLSKNIIDESMFFSIKKIKERYYLHLKSGIESRNWEVEEDLKLLELVNNHGKKWKDFTEIIHGRTELQLKNRYNGTLKLMEKRVFRKLNAFLKKQMKVKLSQNDFS